MLKDARAAAGARSLLAITGLHEVEEDIWSHKYGLRGVIDASIQAIVTEEEGLKREQQCWSLPFEIKTGRSVAGAEHQAQTMLYTLLMAERYGMSERFHLIADTDADADGPKGVPVPFGLLYYTQSDEVIRVAAARNEIRDLIMGRNEMACYIIRRQPAIAGAPSKPFLPPVIADERICGRCYSVDACMLYRKVSPRLFEEEYFSAF